MKHPISANQLFLTLFCLICTGVIGCGAGAYSAPPDSRPAPALTLAETLETAGAPEDKKNPDFEAAPETSADSKDAAIFFPARQWAHAASDLTPDPEVLFKTLPNGFRYVLMQNHRPENRISMHLFVQAGSMHEKDHERGIAHYLEHMLFNGSENFPPGELVKYFQSIGMKFGPDANASTGFYSTVYDIDLPENDPESIAKGLTVMADYAEGALILEREVDKERPIILAEKRTRDSAGYRTFEETFKFELPNALLSDRLPIGTTEVIQNADRNLLKHFYDTWYRPGRMILVMTGDFDMAAAEDLIAEKFDSLAPRAPASDYPDPGFVDHSGIKPFYHYEPETGNTTVSIETITREITPADTASQEKVQLLSSMANHMVNKRLAEMLDDPKTPFTRAMISSGYYLNYLKGAEISADCPPEKWEATLGAIEQILRQALAYGFTENEIKLAQKTFTAALDKAVKAAPTRESSHLARQILHSLNARNVVMSPAQVKMLKDPMITSVTAEDLHQALKNDWDAGHRLILVTGNANLKRTGADPAPTPENRIQAAYALSTEQAVTAPEEKEVSAFPYLPTPAAKGTITRREEIPDLGITRVTFANGVHLSVKATDFKANEVKAALIFGDGRASEPADHPGLASLAQKVVQLSGLGELTRDELKRALTGKNTHVQFQVEEDYFALSGNCVTDETELLFQLFHNYLADPGFRADAYALALDQYKQEYDSLAHSIQGGMVFDGYRFLAGGDTRFGLPDFDTFAKNSLTDIRNWLTPAFREAPVEITLVGNLDPESVIELAALYLGGLPGRHNATGVFASGNRHPAFPATAALTVYVPTVIPKALVTLAFSTNDFRNITENRRLSVLSEIFDDRMRVRIREEMGASYTAYAYNNPSRAYDGYGLLSAVVQADPEDTGTVTAELYRIADDMAEQGITEDELSRAVNPILASIKERVKTNDYWLESVLKRASRYPAQLDWCRSFYNDYAAITASEINALARKYLVTDNAATVVVVPDGKQKPTAAPPEAEAPF